MIKSILLLFAISLTSLVMGQISGAPINVFVESTEPMAELPEGKVAFEFKFFIQPSESFTLEQDVRYSIDREAEQKAKLQADSTLTIVADTGEHHWMVFLNPDFNEIFYHSMSYEEKTKITVQLHFHQQIIMIQPAKPVIYLYPEKPTDVTTKIDIKGEQPFFYPTYKDQWEFKAHPNGRLQFGEEDYRYLFWESEQLVHADISQFKDGFVVQKSEVVSLMEEKLTAMGFNSQEQADFITYWGPQLIQHDQCAIHFIFNEECDDYAELDFHPKPASLFRMYMLWKPVDASFNIAPQRLPRIQRDGFTVIEWGGMKIDKGINTQNH